MSDVLVQIFQYALNIHMLKACAFCRNCKWLTVLLTQDAVVSRTSDNSSFIRMREYIHKYVLTSTHTLMTFVIHVGTLMFDHKNCYIVG